MITKVRQLYSVKNRNLSNDNCEILVKSILDEIKQDGDLAIAKFSKNFDKIDFDLSKQNPFQVQSLGYWDKLDASLKEALLFAKRRIEKFHREEIKNLQLEWSYIGDNQEKLGSRYNPINSVAVYIPGGRAPLISTVLMTVIPAQIAGVKRIVLVSPPQIDSNILALAELLGLKEIYSIGGAQAIGAMAYGSQSIKAVDKIVGPGNIYVSLAKKQVFGQVGIDGIFGPSELAIIADSSANPKLIAIDLLSQLEHGSGLESVLLVSLDQQIIDKSIEQIYLELNRSSKSQEQIQTIKNSIDQWSSFVKVNDLSEAARIVNEYAPEHLELQINNPEEIMSQIKNAGAIFVGANSSEALGDYLAGPSHCLPTSRAARFSSGLQCVDFMTRTSIIDFRNSHNQDLNSITAQIARLEKMEFHALAAEYRNA